MTTTNALTARASGLVAAVTAICDGALSLPANDNAGLAWRLADDAAHDDDRAFGVDVIAAALPSLWRSYSVTSPRAAVRLRSAQEFSRSVNRRVRTLHAMLRAAGVAVEWM